MTLRKFALLFTVLILIGCNQSDSDSEAPPADNAKTDTQSSINENTSAAQDEPERIGKVIARVNGQPIYEDDLNGKSLEDVITEEIIYQEGLSQGIDKKYRDKVKDFERKLIIRDTKQSILENSEPTKKVSDEDIKNYYERNKNKYMHVRINEISFPDSNLANEIREKAQGEEELQTIANSYPDMVITVNDVGYNRNMARHFKTREVGSVSEAIQKPDGTFSILKIVEIKDIPLNASKKSIKHRLEARRKALMFDNYARRAVKEKNMTIVIIEQESKQ